MKTKLVLWGTNAASEKILIAIQLNADKNNIDIWSIPESAVDADYEEKLMNKWRNGENVPFPESAVHVQRDLSVSGDFLPEDIKADKPDIISRAQTEWHFIVLSAKLNETYQEELDALKSRVEQLESFDKDVWDSLKTYWNKVQQQVYDKNLFREHADSLRQNTNELFAKLKELRKALDAEFKDKSEEYLRKFEAELSEIEEKIKKGVRLRPIFEELKNLQKRFKETKLTRENRSQFWKKIDAAFKDIKEQLFGSADAPHSGTKSPLVRLNRRYEGLLGAIERMENSIKRDYNELDFQKKRIEDTSGQLEAQIRQAKIKMTEERINSKNTKLQDMLKTKAELEKRIQSLKEKEEIQKKKDAAKQEIKEKIAAKIKEEHQVSPEEEKKLKEAAKKIKESTAPKEKSKKKPAASKPKQENPVETVAVEIEEVFEDVVDTIKAIAQVVGSKIEEKVEEIADFVEEKAEEEKAKTTTQKSKKKTTKQPKQDDAAAKEDIKEDNNNDDDDIIEEEEIIS